MPWKKGTKIPTNLIVGFLGSGKTTAITNLIAQRASGEHWSVLINEFGTVSIDHALVDKDDAEVAVEELGGGCVCCTMSFAFKPLMAQFIRRSKPDRLIVEPSGVSHPAKVVDILRGEGFAGAIDLRNIICLIDPKDFEDPRWQNSEVYQDQVQLADIVVINWTDSRDRSQIDRCRNWIERFDPAKQLIIETEFGRIDRELLDRKFEAVRFPLFKDAHPLPQISANPLVGPQQPAQQLDVELPANSKSGFAAQAQPSPRSPQRFQDEDSSYNACGWVFHIDDIFDRDRLLDFLGCVQSVVRLKGIFRCEEDWWQINRAKNATDFSRSTYRRDSRLEVILDSPTLDWDEMESGLLACLDGG